MGGFAPAQGESSGSGGGSGGGGSGITLLGSNSGQGGGSSITFTVTDGLANDDDWVKCTYWMDRISAGASLTGSVGGVAFNSELQTDFAAVFDATGPGVLYIEIYRISSSQVRYMWSMRSANESQEYDNVASITADASFDVVLTLSTTNTSWRGANAIKYEVPT